MLKKREKKESTCFPSVMYVSYLINDLPDSSHSDALVMTVSLTEIHECSVFLALFQTTDWRTNYFCKHKETLLEKSFSTHVTKQLVLRMFAMPENWNPSLPCRKIFNPDIHLSLYANSFANRSWSEHLLALFQLRQWNWWIPDDWQIRFTYFNHYDLCIHTLIKISSIPTWYYSKEMVNDTCVTVVVIIIQHVCAKCVLEVVT